MSELIIERGSTALLIMEYQNIIFEMMPTAQEQGLAERARRVLEGSRTAGLFVAFVVVSYRPGYPEISNHDPYRLGLTQPSRLTDRLNFKTTGNLAEGSKGTSIISELTPRPDEPIFTKRRTGAFMHTDLDMTLRAQGIRVLILLGITTSGVVLTTVRTASDLDYGSIVLKDCCVDQKIEVHQCLMNHVFPRDATVIDSKGFLEALSRC